MFRSEIFNYLSSVSGEMPLWIEKGRLMPAVLFVSDLLSTADERAFLRKVAASLELPAENLEIHAQHWTRESLSMLIQEKQPKFIVGFACDPLHQIYGLEKSADWQSVNSSSLRVLAVNSVIEIQGSVVEKKNLWSALKKAKALLGKSRSSI